MGDNRGWETTEGGGQQRVGDNRGWETTEGGGQQRVGDNRGWGTTEGGGQQRVVNNRGWGTTDNRGWWCALPRRMNSSEHRMKSNILTVPSSEQVASFASVGERLQPYKMAGSDMQSRHTQLVIIQYSQC